MNISTYREMGNCLPIVKSFLLFFFLVLQIGLFAQESNANKTFSNESNLFPTSNKSVSYRNVGSSESGMVREAVESQVDISYSPGSNGDIMVNYEMNYNRLADGIPNPHHISFTYSIRKSKNGVMEVEPKSVVDPFLFNMTEDIVFDFEGDYIGYPPSLHVGDRLNQVHSVYTYRLNEKLPLSKYEINLTKREVVRKEILDIDGKQYEAFVVSFNLEVVSSTGEVEYLYSVHTDEVEEWIVPGLGIVKQQSKFNSLSINNLR